MSQCSHDPRQTPMHQGMYACPECGKMVLAGTQHLEYSVLPTDYAPIDRMTYDQLRPSFR